MKVGDVVAGKYRVERILAQKRGYLLEARHTEFDQHVVIRLLAPGMCDRKEVERFRREARTLSKLESEYATRIIDVGTHSDGSFFLVRQYLDGVDLGQYVQQRGALPIDQAILYVLQACEAIQEAHSHNIIIRELSTADLFLTSRRGGSALVKITDFGTAKVIKDDSPKLGGESEMTAIFGISPYASPELVRKTGDIDHRTDVWSMGCILYELLAATKPFSGDMAELMIKITREPPMPLSRMRRDVPKALDQIMDWALAKEPSGRFANIYAFAHALGPYASAEGEVLIDRIGRLANAGSDGPSLGTTNISATSPLQRGAALETYEDEDDDARTVIHTGEIPSAKEDVSDLERTQFYEVPPTNDEVRGSRAPLPAGSQPGTGGASEPGAPGRPNATGSFPAQDEAGQKRRAKQRRNATIAIGAAVFMIPILAVLLYSSLKSSSGPEAASSASAAGGSAPVASASADADAAKVADADSSKGGSAPEADENKDKSDAAEQESEKDSSKKVASASSKSKSTKSKKSSSKKSSTKKSKKETTSKTAKTSSSSSKSDTKSKDSSAKKPTKDSSASSSSGGTGTLVAIAVGGSCTFTVDGQNKGTASSVRLSVPVGVHTVSCARTGQATRSRTVKVRSDKPGMVMFRLN